MGELAVTHAGHFSAATHKEMSCQSARMTTIAKLPTLIENNVQLADTPGVSGLE